MLELGCRNLLCSMTFQMAMDRETGSDGPCDAATMCVINETFPMTRRVERPDVRFCLPQLVLWAHGPARFGRFD